MAAPSSISQISRGTENFILHKAGLIVIVAYYLISLLVPGNLKGRALIRPGTDPQVMSIDKLTHLTFTLRRKMSHNLSSKIDKKPFSENYLPLFRLSDLSLVAEPENCSPDS